MKFLSILIILHTSLLCDIKKGHREAWDQCKKCHSGTLTFSRIYNKDQWNLVFDKNATKIINIHEDTDANKYFRSKGFQNNIVNLNQFFYEYAKDGDYGSCSMGYNR